MNLEKRLITAIESIDTISTRLRELLNLISTVHSGLMNEDAEKQILNCIMCFLYLVNELYEFSEQTIREINTK